jgi:ribonuclease HI
MIAGMEDCSILPPGLCSDLLSQNISFLAQIKVPTASPSLPDNWKGARDLSFFGWRAIAWEHYTTELKCAGISLREEPDSLVWAGGDASGIPSVKNIFSALLSFKNLVPDLSWRQQVWKWKIPLKYKLFVWLAGIDRILTWDSLRRRGWEGHGLYSLCRQAPEDIHHLLIHCKFTKEVWYRLLSQFNLPFTWSGATFTDCFNSWLLNKSAPTCLAAHISWHLWIERNRALFENRSPSTLAVFYRVLATFSWQPSTLKPFIYKELDLRLPAGFTLACFDGAAQANGSCCGAGGFFRAHPERITKWSLNCGRGTNTKAELLGLWVTLSLASCWNITHLHICGDSKVIIDWISKKSLLHSIHTESWKQKTLDLASGIPNLSFQHVYRVFNREADILSKLALREEPGLLSIFHSDKGIESLITQFSVF